MLLLSPGGQPEPARGFFHNKAELYHATNVYQNVAGIFGDWRLEIASDLLYPVLNTLSSLSSLQFPLGKVCLERLEGLGSDEAVAVDEEGRGSADAEA